MNGRCMTCKWWDTEERQRDYERDIGNLSPHDRYRPPSGRGYCTQPAEDAMRIEQRAYCEGDVWIMTAPDFGCILWEPLAEPRPEGSVEVEASIVDRERFERLRKLAEAGRDAMLLTTETHRDRDWLSRNSDAFGRQWAAIDALQPGDLDPLP